MKDLEIVKGKAGRHSERPPFEEFKKLANGRSVNQIAKRFHVSRASIYRWLKKYEEEGH